MFELASGVTMNGATIGFPLMVKYIVISIVPPLTLLLLMPCFAHCFPNFPF
jgi:hypothetical protein